MIVWKVVKVATSGELISFNICEGYRRSNPGLSLVYTPGKRVKPKLDTPLFAFESEAAARDCVTDFEHTGSAYQIWTARTSKATKIEDELSWIKNHGFDFSTTVLCPHLTLLERVL